METLTEPEIRALNEALDDEYRSWATYDQVIADFGELRPFSNIRAAEANHIEALCVLFARYGLALPKNSWPGRVARYASWQAACEAAVTEEVANVEMYERLLGATQRPDILAVFHNLQEASEQRHLPAFRRCARRFIEDGKGARHRQGGRDQS